MVTIEGMAYSGRMTVNQVVPNNFTVNFVSGTVLSDQGFILNWRCTEWGEWNLASDGSCREEQRPRINGLATIGHLKYRITNLTCGNFWQLPKFASEISS